MGDDESVVTMETTLKDQSQIKLKAMDLLKELVHTNNTPALVQQFSRNLTAYAVSADLAVSSKNPLDGLVVKEHEFGMALVFAIQRIIMQTGSTAAILELLLENYLDPQELLRIPEEYPILYGDSAPAALTVQDFYNEQFKFDSLTRPIKEEYDDTAKRLAAVEIQQHSGVLFRDFLHHCYITQVNRSESKSDDQDAQSVSTEPIIESPDSYEVLFPLVKNVRYYKMFKTSEQYKDLQELTTAIEDSYLQQQRVLFWEMHRSYEEAEKKFRLVQHSYERQSKTSVELSLYKEILQAINSFFSSIEKKVKTAIESDSAFIQIKKKLSTPKRIGGKNIKPWEDTLPALYYELHKHYGTPTMKNFILFLGKLISTKAPQSEVDKNPTYGLSMIEILLTEWLKLKMYEFMSMDVLFATVLVQCYGNNTKVREGMLTKLMEFINNTDNDFITNQQKMGFMPMFDVMRQYITTLLEVKETKAAVAPDQSKGVAIPKGGDGPSRNQKQVVTNEQNAFSTENIQKKKPTVVFKTITESFNREVLRDEMFGYKDVHGNWYLYTSTAHPCKNCVYNDGIHVPRCYTLMCLKCRLFGHVKSQCQQESASTKA